ncbi:MAG: HD domain-containing protein [Smithellaceae bacterium]|nr:HD domain-containing protein [Smithellaceae bacterium]
MADFQSTLARSGQEFLKFLYRLINTVRIYRDNNHLIRKGVGELKGVMDSLSGGDDISVHLWRGRFHIRGERLQYRRDLSSIINGMVAFFTQRTIGQIIFFNASKNVSTEDFVAVIRLLNDSVMSADPPAWFEEKILEHGFSWVQVIRKQDEELSVKAVSLEDERYEKARSTYIHAVDTVREVAQKACKGIVGVRKTRRLAQNIVDLVREDNSLMLGLASIKDYDDYTYTHSVNVALLATCLGRQINMSDISLEYLSVCGLLHDLGKVGVSKDVLHKQGELSMGEWDQMKAHPLIGVRKILRLNAPHKLRSRIILGPFEHHLNPDMSGYPRTIFMDKISLIGKILRISDVYEALTAQRAYRARAYAPDEALRKMWSERGQKFDPILLKSFIRMMGIYPVGSMVELSDGNFALIMDYPEESRNDLPLVLLLVNDGKGNLIRGDMVYLADQVAKGGSPSLNVVRGIEPTRFGIQAAEFFLHEK